MSFLLNLFFSGITGYIAGRIMDSKFSAFKSILIGFIGGIVGSGLFSLFGLAATGFVGSLIVSVIGACVCILLARKFTH